MTPEAKVKEKVVKIIKERNAYYFFPVGGPYGRRGIPDIVGCYKGHFFAVECKAPGKSNTVTELQKREMTKILEGGGIVWVIDDAEDFRGIFRLWTTTMDHITKGPQ